jgi:hypothetical protein
MKNTMKYAIVGALFAAAAPFAVAAERSAADVKKCSAVYQSASKAIAKDPAKVLELVSKLVAANESCAAEVVKAAIVTTKASGELVGQIVETAATVAPKQLSQIAAAAMAVAVDSRVQIATVINKINAQLGTAQSYTKDQMVSMFPENSGYSFELSGNSYSVVQSTSSGFIEVGTYASADGQ